MGDVTYLTWYTHCGSTNHGMQVQWSTDDAETLNIQVTQYLQADLLMFSPVDLTASGYEAANYYLDPAVYTTSSDGSYFKTAAALCADEASCDGAWP